LAARRKREKACNDCKLWNRNQTGKLECSKPKGCDAPKESGSSGEEELDRYAQRVLAFFTSIVGSLWKSGEGAPHVPRHELEVEARIRGVELSEHFLDKFAACEVGFAKAQEYLRAQEKEQD
jgi:hypothetical protein